MVYCIFVIFFINKYGYYIEFFWKMLKLLLFLLMDNSCIGFDFFMRYGLDYWVVEMLGGGGKSSFVCLLFFIKNLFFNLNEDFDEVWVIFVVSLIV